MNIQHSGSFRVDCFLSVTSFLGSIEMMPGCSNRSLSRQIFKTFKDKISLKCETYAGIIRKCFFFKSSVLTKLCSKRVMNYSFCHKINDLYIKKSFMFVLFLFRSCKQSITLQVCQPYNDNVSIGIVLTHLQNIITLCSYVYCKLVKICSDLFSLYILFFTCLSNPLEH